MRMENVVITTIGVNLAGLFIGYKRMQIVGSTNRLQFAVARNTFNYHRNSISSSTSIGRFELEVKISIKSFKNQMLSSM